MFQLKTGRQLVIQQEFNRRLLSEYNPHFTLDKYVAYLELKNIISDIVVEQCRFDSMCEKAMAANNNKNSSSSNNNQSAGNLSSMFAQNSSDATSDLISNMRRKESSTGGTPSSLTTAGPNATAAFGGASVTAPAAVTTQIYTYLYTHNKTPMIGPNHHDGQDEEGEGEDMPTMNLGGEASSTDGGHVPTASAVTPSANIPTHLPGRLLLPKAEDIEKSHATLMALHAKFFDELKKSHRRVKSFLVEKENAATAQIEELKKFTEASLAKLPPNAIPSIFRRVRNIALFRDLNTVGFQHIMQKYFQMCCTKSLEQQQKLRAADTIIANSHLCKPTFDADQQLDLITSIYATINKESYESARQNLDLAIERDLSTHRRIIPVTQSYFYTSGFVHHQYQGSFALKLVCGLGGKPLTKKMSALSHTPILNLNNKILPGGELAPKLHEAVRGDDVFVVQSMAAAEGRSMSTSIMQLALTMQTLSLASAARVTAVVPYMAYNSTPNASAAIAEIMMVNGCKQVLTLDLQSDQVEGMFGNLPIYSVTALMEFISYLTDRVVKEEQSVRNLVVVSPDGDGVARARRFADAFAKNLNKVLFGAESNALHRPARDQITLPSAEDDSPMFVPPPGSNSAVASSSFDENSESPSRTLTRLQSTLLGSGRSLLNSALGKGASAAVASPQPLLSAVSNDASPQPNLDRVFIPIATALKRPSHECDDIDVIGDVSGQHCYIVDTIIDEAVNATTVAKKLKMGGATRVTVVATHALFSSAASLDLIEQPWIDEILITDSVSQDSALARPAVAKKLRILSVAPLLAEAMQRLHSDNCLSTLFDR